MPNCLRCGYAFKADLPEWLATVTCDRCASELTTYFASSKTPRQAAARIKASRRLYAPAEVPTAGEVLPCEVDFTPEPAPSYDELVISGRRKGYGAFLNQQAAAARGNPVPVVPTHIDPMYEAVARGEARARAHADRSRTGFGQSLTDGAI